MLWKIYKEGIGVRRSQLPSSTACSSSEAPLLLVLLLVPCWYRGCSLGTLTAGSTNNSDSLPPEIQQQPFLGLSSAATSELRAGVKMKFSKRLQELRERRRAAFYVSYKELKKALKLITGADVSAVSISDAVSSFAHTKALEGEHYRPPESRFEDLLQHELEKVNTFSVSALLAASAALQQLLLQLYALQHKQQELLLNPLSAQQQQQEAQRHVLQRPQQLDSNSRQPKKVSSDDKAGGREAPSAAVAAAEAAAVAAASAAAAGDSLSEDAAAATAAAFERELLAVEAALDAQGQEVVFLSSYTRLNFTAFRKIAKKFDKLNKSTSAAYHMCRVMRQPFMRLNIPLLLQQLAAACAQLRALKAMRDFPEAATGAAREAGRGAAGGSVATATAPGAAAAAVAAAAAAAARCAADCGAEGISQNTTKYLVLPDEVVRLQVVLARHLQLTSIKGCCVDTTTPLPAAAATAVAAAAAATGDGRSYFQNNGRGNLSCSRDSSDSSSSNRVAEALASGDSRRLSSIVYFDTPQLDVFVALQTKGRTDGKKVDGSSDSGGNSSSSPTTSSGSSVKELLRIREVNAGESTATSQGPAIFLEFANSQEPATDPQQHIFPAYDCPEVLDALPRSVLVHQQQLKQLLAGEAEAAAQQLEQQLLKAGVPRGKAASRAALLREAGQALAQQGLQPCLRVWLTRTCFSSEDGSIVVTLDEDIRFSRKGSDTDTNAFLFNGAAALASEGAAPFPWGVMDVSCRRPPGRARPPQSAGSEELSSPFSCLREVIGMASVTEVFGFSLFIHGVASCFQQELQRLVQERGDRGSGNGTSLVPHWLPYTTIAEEDDEEFQAAADFAAAGAPSPPPCVQGSSLRGVLSPPQQQQQLKDEEFYQENHSATGRHSTRASKLDVIYRGPGASIAHDQEASVQELRHSLETSSTGAPLLSNGAPVTSNRGRGLREPLLGSGNNSSSSSSRATVRVEPKTFFANERTLLQWLNIAVLLASVAITLLSFGQTAAKAAGLLLSPVAIFFIGYSFWIYLRRSRALLRKEPIDYNDHIGPAILVVSLMLALCANIVLNVVYNEHHAVTTVAPSKAETRVSSVADAASASLFSAERTAGGVAAVSQLADAAAAGFNAFPGIGEPSGSIVKHSSSSISNRRLDVLKAAIAAGSYDPSARSTAEHKSAARLAAAHAAEARDIARLRAAEAVAAAAAAEKAAAAAKDAEAAAAEAEATAMALRSDEA
ncbi:hypothetical protein Esti_003967 [Eimeria stiedai]